MAPAGCTGPSPPSLRRARLAVRGSREGEGGARVWRQARARSRGQAWHPPWTRGAACVCRAPTAAPRARRRAGAATQPTRWRRAPRPWAPRPPHHGPRRAAAAPATPPATPSSEVSCSLAGCGLGGGGRGWWGGRSNPSRRERACAGGAREPAEVARRLRATGWGRLFWRLVPHTLIKGALSAVALGSPSAGLDVEPASELQVAA